MILLSLDEYLSRVPVMTHCVLIILPFFNDISKGMTHPGNKSYHIDSR